MVLLKIRTKCNSVVSSHYSLNDFVLSNVKLVNDLGVYVDSNLSFKHQI